MVLNSKNLIFEMISSITLNNIKNFLLLIIIPFGTFYSFSIEPSMGWVIVAKRLSIIMFIYIELCHLILIPVKRSYFYIFILLNIIYLVILGFINSGFIEVTYFTLSLFFIMATFSHFSRISSKDLISLINLLFYSILLVIFSFIALMFSYFVFEEDYVRELFYFGFGNDYSNFSVWAGYLAILITYLEVRFNFAGRFTHLFLATLFVSVIIAGGRTGAIMIMGSYAVYLYFNYKDSVKFISTKLLILFISMVCLFFYLGGDTRIIGRFSNIFHHGTDLFLIFDYLLSGRVTIFQGAIDQFLNESNIREQFFGLGIWNFNVVHNGTPYQVHNFLLRYLLEIGLFGMLLFFILYIYPFFAKYQNGYKSLTIALYLVASITPMISPGSFFTSMNICASIWVIVAISTQMDIEKS